LLRVRLTGADGKPYDEYEGAALLKIRQLTLSAIGAYAFVGGYPSLFVYAVLDYPIGGPSFFFVTGLAAGFGYNRLLHVPPVDQVAQFPLISEVMPPEDGAVVPAAGGPPNPLAELEKLRAYVVPSPGDLFLAVGIRFTSFKQIDSFALLTILFGRRFEIDVLGLSTLKAPNTQGVSPPLAEVQMALKASFIPDEGFLGVEAQLTSASYLFSRNCHLTGGFAFYSWFSGDHAGDFVTTIGGYHPRFSPPAHYPRVPRLGFNWQVNAELSIKGDAYFALTPTALMAGGHLQAAWISGNLSASFNAGADFLVAWKPYHYEADIYVNIGVRYTYHFFGTHTISVDVGADLSIWGPEFSGRAHIHLWIVTFDVTFGAAAAQRPAPIDWDAFHSSFLPPDTGQQTICTIAVQDGLLRPGATGTDWVVSPRGFTLATNSAVPAKRYDVHGATVAGPSQANAFGIAPMGLTATQFDSTHSVTITRAATVAGDQDTDVTKQFTFAPVLKPVPKALWGESVEPQLSGEALIKDTLSGFTITPTAPVAPPSDPPETLPAAEARFSTTRVDQAFAWQAERAFTPAPKQGTEEVARALDAAAARRALLADLGLADESTVGAQTAEAFLVAPQVGKLVA
jgi:hypothetical protein